MSLRLRILLLVLGVALLPLGLLGWWLSGTAARSGEVVLSARLEEELAAAATEMARRWTRQRSQLLDLGDSSRRPSPRGALDTASLDRAAAALEPPVASVALHDTLGATVWRHARADAPSGGDLLVARVPIYAPDTARLIGTIEASLHVALLLSNGTSARPGIPGVILGAIDPESGASLLPLPIDAATVRQPRFELLGERWLSERRPLTEPRIDLVAAAPLTPFVQPFETAARTGFWLVVITSTVGLLATLWLTTRMTRSLAQLAAAADAIGRGELERRVPDSAGDEVGRVSRAFNTMAASLDRTLAQLSQRESLAAVGAFASELAHEVRNPLTAIRVDLEIVEERLANDPSAKEALAAALAQVERLDHTVAGALQLARSGRVSLTPLDVRDAVRAAARSARPAFDEAAAKLRVVLPGEPLPCMGDAAALQQMILNLLLNAANALGAGGEASIDAVAEAHTIRVRVADTGCGMSAEVLARVREPFFTTREGGTGLGLGIAERIARAHGGTLDIESTEGRGTTVTVTLPTGAVDDEAGR